MNEPMPIKLREVQNEVAKEKGYPSWGYIKNECRSLEFQDEVENEAIERYANHIREEAYKRGWNEALYWAATHVETKHTFLQEVDKQSILKGLKP